MLRRDFEAQKIALGQHGVIATDQLQRLEFSDRQIARRVRAGEWVRELPGVWRLSWVEPSWMQKVWCASLHAGDEALISHQAAAWLWDLEGVKLEKVDVSTPRPLRKREWFVPHRIDVPRKMRRTRRGIPLTSPCRTLVDLANRVDADALQRMLEESLRRRIITVGELQRVLRLLPERGKSGTGIVSRMLEQGLWDERAQSELERQAMALFRESGLPRPERWYRVVEEDCRLAEVDFAWPKAKVIVEVEGFQFHSGREDWESDIARYNSLTFHGWKVLRLTRDQLRDEPEEFAAAIGQAIARGLSRATDRAA